METWRDQRIDGWTQVETMRRKTIGWWLETGRDQRAGGWR
jgi:hypothetical protein